MVDRAARDQYAELLRHFTSGRMTIDDFEKRGKGLSWNPKDRGLRAVAYESTILFEEYGEDTADGRFRLEKCARGDLARLVAFLYSDVEYKWRETPSDVVEQPRDLLPALPAAIGFGLMVTLLPWAWIPGIVGSLVVHQWMTRSMRLAQADGIWPFLELEEMKEARRHPRLLAGRVSP